MYRKNQVPKVEESLHYNKNLHARRSSTAYFPPSYFGPSMLEGFSWHLKICMNRKLGNSLLVWFMTRNIKLFTFQAWTCYESDIGYIVAHNVTLPQNHYGVRMTTVFTADSDLHLLKEIIRDLIFTLKHTHRLNSTPRVPRITHSGFLI